MSGRINIPWDKVLPNAAAGGPIMNSLNAMNEVQKNSITNQYLPATLRANALSKTAYANYLPYQLQAQALSNPMLWMTLKDHPEMANQLMQNLASSMPKPDQVMQNAALPSPNGGGLWGMLMDKLTGNSSNQQGNPMNPSMGNQDNQNPMANIGGPQPNSNPMANPSGQRSALVPASNGGVGGVTGKMTAPYTISPYSGKTFYDDQSGLTISSPTNETTTALQNSMNAARRVAPQLERLATAAGPFMTAQGMAHMGAQTVENAFSPSEERKLPTQYANFKSLVKAAPESLVKTYGLRPTNETIQRMEEIIEPHWGETKEQYKQRIFNQLQHLKSEQIDVAKEESSQGFTVNGPQANNVPENNPLTYSEGKEPPAGAVWMKTPENTIVPVSKKYMKDAKKSGLKEIE